MRGQPGDVDWGGRVGRVHRTRHALERVTKVELQVELLKHKLVCRRVQRLGHRSCPRLLEVRLRMDHAEGETSAGGGRVRGRVA